MNNPSLHNGLCMMPKTESPVPLNTAPSKETSYQRTLIGYTPRQAFGCVSLVSHPTLSRVNITTDKDLITIPANAIIDSIEYFGVSGFATKGLFSIGIGQLNDMLLLTLIEDADMAIANERIGGSRHFFSTSLNGANTKELVLFTSNVNVALEHPITTGSLQVVISYHLKPDVEPKQ